MRLWVIIISESSFDLHTAKEIKRLLIVFCFDSESGQGLHSGRLGGGGFHEEAGIPSAPMEGPWVTDSRFAGEWWKLWHTDGLSADGSDFSSITRIITYSRGALSINSDGLMVNQRQALVSLTTEGNAWRVSRVSVHGGVCTGVASSGAAWRRVSSSSNRKKKKTLNHRYFIWWLVFVLAGKSWFPFSKPASIWGHSCLRKLAVLSTDLSVPQSAIRLSCIVFPSAISVVSVIRKWS